MKTPELVIEIWDPFIRPRIFSGAPSIEEKVFIQSLQTISCCHGDPLLLPLPVVT